jgi:hypothetical protein
MDAGACANLEGVALLLQLPATGAVWHAGGVEGGLPGRGRIRSCKRVFWSPVFPKKGSAAMVRRRGVMMICASICCCQIAAAVTVNFDDLPSSTPVRDQYLGDGVKFIDDVHVIVGFQTTDATYGGILTVPSPPNWVGISSGTQTLRFFDPTNPARLATTDSVAVDTPALSSGCFDAIEMKAFDPQHKLIDTATTPAVTSSSPKTTTTVSGTGIHYLRMTRLVSGCVAPFDNLVFTDVVLSDTIFFDDLDNFE